MIGEFPTVAMVVCVRNEAEFLPAFLTYHRALGIHRAYVFLDRSTDGSRAILQKCSWVEIIERDQPAGATQLALHQMKCADEALLRARRDGCDWLLMLDADEFAWGGGMPPRPSFARRLLGLSTVTAAEGNLARLAAGVAAETEMIQLATAEVVPEAMRWRRPFWKLAHFQTGERAMVRPVLDPVAGEVRSLGRWLGHRKGKAMVRVSCDVQAFDSHVWTRRQDRDVPELLPLATEQRGLLLHYVVTGAAHWQRKYRQLSFEADRWLRGEPVEFPKQAWKIAAARMTTEEAADYFRSWVAVNREQVKAARAEGIVQRISIVADVLREVGFSGDMMT